MYVCMCASVCVFVFVRVMRHALKSLNKCKKSEFFSDDQVTQKSVTNTVYYYLYYYDRYDETKLSYYYDLYYYDRYYYDRYLYCYDGYDEIKP